MWDDLVCPFDHGSLDAFQQWLACRQCGRGYPIVHSIPRFLPPQDKASWRRMQRARLRRIRGEDLRAAPPARRAVQVQRRLQAAAPQRPPRKVLQVGVPGEAEIHYLPGNVRYALEPLAGALAADDALRFGPVRWVHGWPEALPFPSENFQWILLGDALCWSAAPEEVLAEAARCLTPDGLLWLSVPLRRSPRLGRVLGRRGAPPRGAARTFDETDLEQLLAPHFALESRCDQPLPAAASPDHAGGSRLRSLVLRRKGAVAAKPPAVRTAGR